MILNILNISVSYDKKTVINNFSYEFKPGTVYSIIGANGSGKTTLLKAISGVKKIDNGQINYIEEGKALNLKDITPKQRAKLISVVPQNSFSGGAMSVYDVVALGRTPHLSFTGKIKNEDQMIINKIIRDLELEKFSTRQLSMLSGGEQQRVLLARALVQETPIILFDEPTNHLDIKYQLNFLNMIRKIVNNQNKIAIIAMHDLNLALNYTDEALMLHQNQLYTSGITKKIINPKTIKIVYDTDVQIISDNKQSYMFPKIQELK